MSKVKTAFFCSHCGYESAKWVGKCPACQQWNTFVEEVLHKEGSKTENLWKDYRQEKRASHIIALDEVVAAAEPRIVTSDPELNRVLGGGIVPGSIILVAGEPGIGKSSIMKMLSAALPGHLSAYIDVPNMDLGDIAMPSMNRDMRVTEYFPNAALQLQTGKPVVIMLDEFTKAPQPVQNMLHPLLEARNPRLGDNYGRDGHNPSFDVRNNVIYNYGGTASGLTQGKFTANYVANYLRPGPSSRARTPITVDIPSAS